MFNTILVALDGTPEAATGLPLAALLAQGQEAGLVLVQVCEDYHGTSRAHIAAHDYLAACAAGLASYGLHVGIDVRYGDVAEQIVAASRQHGADLVLLTTHGRQGLARAWYGSVTEDVVAKSPVPVLVLRPGEQLPRQLQTLLVPLDDSPGSAAALTVARAVASVPAASLILLRVIPPLPRWGRGWDINPAWETTMAHGAQESLDLLAHALQHQGITASGRAAIGPVAETIAKEAHEAGADLILMGTHALVGPRRAVIGSVADEVVRTADRPVLLVRQSVGGTTAVVDERDQARPDIISSGH